MAAEHRSESDVRPFFHEKVLEHWRHDRRNVVHALVGFRGSGKSRFIEVAADSLYRGDADELAATASMDPPYIRGRDRVAARAAIRDLNAAKSITGCLLIDDLDRLLQVRHAAEAEEVQEIIQGLEPLFRRDELRILFSSTLPQDEIAAPSPRLSDSIREATPLVFDPWRLDWPGILGSAIDTILHASGASAVRLWDVPVPFDASLKALWVRATLYLSAGHPVLVDAALEALSEFSSHESGGQSRPRPVHSTEQMVLALLDDHLARAGFGRIRRRITALKTSCDLLERSAFAELARLARSPAQSERLPVREAQILERAGLVIRDPLSRQSSVPGAMIRREMTDDLRPSDDRREITILPDSHTPLDRGSLVVWTEIEPVEVALTGRPWQVARHLFDNRGELVSLQQLEHQLAAPGLPATRLAIQRLSDRLKEHGVGALLENKRGKGYRLKRVAL